MVKRRVMILLLVVAVLAGCSHAAAPTSTPVATASSLETAPRPSSGTVIASGQVVPKKWVSLSARAGGTAMEVLVEPGQQVLAGAPLVRLDTADLQISLRQAQQGVVLQQTALDQLLQGASNQVVARAERDHAHQVTQAELALEESQQHLEQAHKSDPGEDVTLAQARVRQLELQLDQARVQDPAPGVTAARVALERARIALDDTQDEYNQALDRPWEDQAIRDTWAKRLKQAQLDYEVAQAQLDSASNAQRAHELGLRALAVQVEEAKAQLAQAIRAQEAYSVTLTMLDIESTMAQETLDHLRAWENPYLDKASDAEIVQARTRLEQATLAAAQVEQQIKDAEIRAPFDGTAISVEVRAGELVAPGQALVVLADLHTLRVETTDLSERDVDQVKVGQPATAHIEALNVQAQGQVTDIALEATTVGGDVVYKVTVELNDPPPGLRWGMSADVDISTK
jgi:multidrug efflux pump subunit AcrA (membrane-fusion protein)